MSIKKSPVKKYTKVIKDDGNVKLLVNGVNINDENPEVVLCTLLSMISIKHSPISVIRENLRKIETTFIEYCEDRQLETKGSEKAKITRSISRANKLIELWLKLKDINELRSRFYDKLLSVEGLSTLRGYGAVTRFGDKLYGDPEKTSIMSMRSSV